MFSENSSALDDVPSFLNLPYELHSSLPSNLSYLELFNFARTSKQSLLLVADYLYFINIETSAFVATYGKTNCYFTACSIWNMLLEIVKPEQLRDKSAVAQCYNVLKTKAVSLAMKYYLNLACLYQKTEYRTSFSFFEHQGKFVNELKDIQGFSLILIVELEKHLFELKQRVEQNTLLTDKHKECVSVIIHIMACLINSLLSHIPSYFSRWSDDIKDKRNPYLEYALIFCENNRPAFGKDVPFFYTNISSTYIYLVKNLYITFKKFKHIREGDPLFSFEWLNSLALDQRDPYLRECVQHDLTKNISIYNKFHEFYLTMLDDYLSSQERYARKNNGFGYFKQIADLTNLFNNLGNLSPSEFNQY